MKLPCWLKRPRQTRPYVMDTGWVRGMHGDLDGEALYRWAAQLEADIEKIRNSQPYRRVTIAEFKSAEEGK